MVVLYHESKLNQFNSSGTVLISKGDYGIGQINKSTWNKKTQLSDEGIAKVDWKQVESSWKYNISVALAILDNETKAQKSTNTENNQEMSNRDIFISTYARYNGGARGYERYLEQYEEGNGNINAHIHGSGGLIADLHNLSRLIDEKIETKKQEIDNLIKSESSKVGTSNNSSFNETIIKIAQLQGELNELETIQKDLIEFKKKVGEHSTSDNATQ